MNAELKKKLEKLAYQRTKPFCYSCYETAPTGRCKKCHSDDLMRELDGVGVEYGTDWVIKHIVESELEEVDIERNLEQCIADCYGETTKIGFIEVDTARAIQELDPVAWKCALSDEESQLIEDDQIIEIGGKYYWTHDAETLVDDIDLEEVQS
jgi:hypothetical protein